MPDFNQVWTFKTGFHRSHNINLTEIHSLGAALMHADKRTVVPSDSISFEETAFMEIKGHQQKENFKSPM
jgi:hypothetical protein